MSIYEGGILPLLGCILLAGLIVLANIETANERRRLNKKLKEERDRLDRFPEL